MKFSSCCYITGPIKEALGFTLMTTAAFRYFGTTSHTPSCFFPFFWATFQDYTDVKTLFKTVLFVPQATEKTSTTSLPQPHLYPTVKHCDTHYKHEAEVSYNSLPVFKKGKVPFQLNLSNSTCSSQPETIV